ncbi:MAG TPA: diguanylate cyclase, partial [Methylophaga sp.]|nr:diguanylate cyclase [Methylophaga sp.]
MLAHFTIRGYQRRLELMATKDKLTGATSRQVFDWVFNKAQKTALRKDWSLSMIVLDIDHFKLV